MVIAARVGRFLMADPFRGEDAIESRSARTSLDGRDRPVAGAACLWRVVEAPQRVSPFQLQMVCREAGLLFKGLSACGLLSGFSWLGGCFV